MLSLILKLFGCGNKSANEKTFDASNPMKEFKQNLETNRILTREVLDTTPDEKLEDKIIANINSKLGEDFSNEKGVLPALSKERQAIYYIYLIEMEVNNGGFDQFYLNKFVNHDGAYMFDKTSEAFQLVGATKFADLIRRADLVYKENKENFRDKEGLFEKLDQEFYNTYKQENLFELRTQFIRDHISAFTDK